MNNLYCHIMKFIRDVGSSMFFYNIDINGNLETIMEYDIVKRKSYVRFKTTQQIWKCTVLNNKKIFVGTEKNNGSIIDSFYLDNQIIKLPKLLIKNVNVNVLETIHGLIIVVDNLKECAVIHNEKITYHKASRIASSKDNHNIIFDLNEKFYYKNIYYCNVDELFCDGHEISIWNCRGPNRCFGTSSRYWIDNYFFGTGCCHDNIHNKDTKITCLFKHDAYFYCTSTDLFFSYHNNDNVKTINIYNANTLKIIKTITLELNIIGYNKDYDLWMTTGFKCYKMTRFFELKEVHIGENYLVDQRKIPNTVMDIVLINELLFDLMPLELVCIELYREILN